MRVEVLHDKLLTLRLQYALDALQKTGDKKEFDFGFRSGVVEGLSQAIQMIHDSLEEEKKSDPL